VLNREDQDAIRRLTTTMAELSASYANGKGFPPEGE
jgi:hypothetical protein